MPGTHKSGRKALPDKLKILKGTFREHRSRNTPKPSADKPLPPSALSRRGKQIFHQLVKRLEVLGVASSTYTDEISIIARRIEEVEVCDKVLNEGGFTFTSKKIIFPATKNREAVISETIVRRPEVKIRSDAMRHLQSLFSDFGLNASSAGKIAKPKENKGDGDNEFANLNKGKK